MEMVDKVLIERIKEKYLNVTGFTGLKTGFKGIDSLTGGFANGQLIVMGGRPGMGKTTFTCSLIDNICLNDNKSCVFFSSEMTKKQTIDRLMRIHSNIKYYERDPDEIADRLINSAAVMEKAKLRIDTAYICDCDGFIESCKNDGRKERVDLIIIDYQELLEGDKRHLSRELLGLKELAEELDCPVLVILQLKRTVEYREDHMPCIADFAHEQIVEKYADEILLLYREAYYDPYADLSKAVIKLARHKYLWNMNIPMRFDTEVFAFRDEE
jgi:replicative DNA helicase